MTIGDLVEAYAAALLGLLPERAVYPGVSALIARDRRSSWLTVEN